VFYVVLEVIYLFQYYDVNIHLKYSLDVVSVMV